MSGKKREYPSLDSVFNNLQVTSVEERQTVAKKPTCDVTSHQEVTALLDNKVERTKIALGKKLNARRRRSRRRNVIRKAKLILPKKFTSKKENDVINDDDDDDDGDDDVRDEGDDDVFLSENESAAMQCVRSATPTCGAQYLQQSTSSGATAAPGPEESNPDELASYFEQILFIPKPMSLMAQMMYA